METKNFRFKGHESFVPREGWFTKALLEINASDGEATFKEHYGADRLGVGPNMAKAIRYWLEASGLIRVASGKVYLTEIGEIILDKDPYIEDIFTLWIIQLNIATNKEKATAWYLFFSLFEMESFTIEELKSVMLNIVQTEYGGDKMPSNNSVIADCEAILQMYAKQRAIDNDPEEKKKSPLYSLRLIRNEGDSYRKIQPTKNQLDRFVIWYGICKSIENDSVSLDDLVSKPGFVGKSLNMKRTMLIEYLDELADIGKLSINKTAGLDMVYLNEIETPEQIIKEYFENRR